MSLDVNNLFITKHFSLQEVFLFWKSTLPENFPTFQNKDKAPYLYN